MIRKDFSIIDRVLIHLPCIECEMDVKLKNWNSINSF